MSPRPGALGPLEAADRRGRPRPRGHGRVHEHRRRGPHAACCVGRAAATSTAVFQALVEQVLAPALRERPDAVVVMDNLAAHKAQAVQEALPGANTDHSSLPACPPDLTRVEPCCAKLKARLRAKEARSLGAPEAELGPALPTITPQD